MSAVIHSRSQFANHGAGATTSIILLSKRGFAKRRLARGVLPANAWTQSDFQKSLYKYIGNQQLQWAVRERAQASILERQKESYHDPTNFYANSVFQMNYKNLAKRNPSIVNDFNRFDTQKRTIDRTERIQRVRNDLNPTKNPNNRKYGEFDPLNTFFRQSKEMENMSQLNSNNNENYVNANEIENENEYLDESDREFDDNIGNQLILSQNSKYEEFAPQIWTKYAYKTFIIDRSKSGNLPVYKTYVPKVSKWYVEIRKIKGSKQHFARCLQAKLGPRCEIQIKQSGVLVWGVKYLRSVREFLLEMGF